MENGYACDLTKRLRSGDACDLKNKKKDEFGCWHFLLYTTLNLYGFDQDMTVIGVIAGLYRTLLINDCFIVNQISRVR